jgi:glycosyltransferase involved in cell wall biosynthesis
VLPTFSEALPTVVMEAMAARLPVVASEVGGVPEIVEAEKTGRLVRAGDAAQLARAIADLLGDRATLERMSREALPSVQRRFSTAAWLARLDALYAEALA